MSRIIRNAAVVADPWQVFSPEADSDLQTLPLPTGPQLLPLPVWQARREEILARGEAFGLWLAPADDPAEIAADLGLFALIAVNFPKFADGRGYSTARLLRQRYGYQGELRAIGDVLHDQLHYLRRVGFDSFALKEGKDPATALPGLTVFSEAYQTAVDQPEPLFRRRQA
ncbi:MAG: hypothetical protein RIR00_2429 [Pseudomonadota bacterium]|jgi:uncharacterized protein (DUF934 family)